MAKRGHGEGSIFRRKSDGRWSAILTVGDGKRKYFYGATRKEVQDKLKQAQRDLDQGKLIIGPHQPLSHFLDHWLEDVHKPTIRQSSYIKYRRFLDRHILPALGTLPVNKVTPQHIQGLYGQLTKAGLSGVTIRSIHGLLHRALATALRWNLVSSNACDAVTLPRYAPAAARPLSRDEIRRLLDAARGHTLEALLTLAVTTGMREGELLGLRWPDIDFQHASLSLQRTVSYLSGHGFVEHEPKTASGKRRVALSGRVLETLTRHRERQRQLRATAGPSWQDRDLVFCTATGNYIHPGNLIRTFRQVLAKASLPRIRFHDLRHSAATMLLSQGIHPKVVQELLGHRTITMTMDTYSHVLPSLQQEAMQQWDTLLGEWSAGHNAQGS